MHQIEQQLEWDVRIETSKTNRKIENKLDSSYKYNNAINKTKHSILPSATLRKSSSQQLWPHRRGV